MSAKEKVLEVRIVVDGGFEGNFHHTALWFFLPLFDRAMRKKSQGICERYWVEDVGIRRKLFAEILQVADIDVIWSEKSVFSLFEGESVELPAWDKSLIFLRSRKAKRAQWLHRKKYEIFVQQLEYAWKGEPRLLTKTRNRILKRLLKSYWQPDVLDLFQAAHRFRQWLEMRFPMENSTENLVCLVIQRFQNDPRRWENVEEISRGVRLAGMSPVVANLNQLTFLEQLDLVRRASAIVAVRGSAFVHLWWAPPKAKAVIIDVGKPWSFIYILQSLVSKRPFCHNFVQESGGENPGIRLTPHGVHVEAAELAKMLATKR